MKKALCIVLFLMGCGDANVVNDPIPIEDPGPSILTAYMTFNRNNGNYVADKVNVDLRAITPVPEEIRPDYSTEYCIHMGNAVSLDGSEQTEMIICDATHLGTYNFIAEHRGNPEDANDPAWTSVSVTLNTFMNHQSVDQGPFYIDLSSGASAQWSIEFIAPQ